MNRRKSIILTSVLTGLAVICALTGIALLIFIFLRGESNRFEPFKFDELRLVKPVEPTNNNLQ